MSGEASKMYAGGSVDRISKIKENEDKMTSILMEKS
jgi:hypothetical protein